MAARVESDGPLARLCEAVNQALSLGRNRLPVVVTLNAGDRRHNFCLHNKQLFSYDQSGEATNDSRLVVVFFVRVPRCNRGLGYGTRPEDKKERKVNKTNKQTNKQINKQEKEKNVGAIPEDSCSGPRLVFAPLLFPLRPTSSWLLRW
jgi:hypothetical protein